MTRPADAAAGGNDASAGATSAMRSLRAPAWLVVALLGPTTSALAADRSLPTGFHEPRPGLYTGGRPDANALRIFGALGVDTVIDLRGDDERAVADTRAVTESLGLRHEVLAIEGPGDLTPENAERLKHALDQSDGQVLLHCASGNRVGALLALMAFHHEDESRRQALEFGRAAGLKSLEPEVDMRLRQSRRSR